MKNSLPFLDPQDAPEGVKTFSEGVRLFSNLTPLFLFKCHRLKDKSVHYAGLVVYISPHPVGVPCSFQFVFV